MRIAVLSETDPVETRVAATPDMVKKYKNLGAKVLILLHHIGRGGHAGLNRISFGENGDPHAISLGFAQKA